MKKVVVTLQKFFNKGHERTLAAKRNIAISLLIKCGSVLTAFVSIPIIISYVNATQYGVWLTLSSVFVWFSLFDIGFGNGLKNKLTQALADGDYSLAKIYVSTTYFIVSLISAGLFAVFVVMNYFLDWSKVFNVPNYMSEQLGLVVVLVFSIFSVQFILQLINIVCLSNQNTITTSLISFVGNVIGLLGVIILAKTTKGSLFYLCLSIGISPLLSLVVFSFILYSNSYKKLSPSFKFIRLSRAREIMSLGIKFFAIQIGLIFYYNSDNLIITQILGPQAVTPYNIAFRYFGIISLISSIVMTPFWAAFAEANFKKDFIWIKKTVKQLEHVCLIIFLLSLFMLAISPYVYNLWLGDRVVVPFAMSALFCFFTTLNMYRTIFCYYMNGTGKISLQIYLVVISGIINIPLAIFLCKLIGATGVLLSTTFLCLICAFFEIKQYKKLINNTATGIWNR